MENEKTHPDHNAEAEDPLQYLREKAQEEEVSSPQVKKRGWEPKEMGGKRKAWLIRGLIVILGIITAVDLVLIQRQATAPVIREYQGGPPTQVKVAPANQAVQPTPTIRQDGFDENAAAPDPQTTYSIPATPTEPPLPEELQGVELPQPPD